MLTHDISRTLHSGSKIAASTLEASLLVCHQSTRVSWHHPFRRTIRSLKCTMWPPLGIMLITFPSYIYNQWTVLSIHLIKYITLLIHKLWRTENYLSGTANVWHSYTMSIFFRKKPLYSLHIYCIKALPLKPPTLLQWTTVIPGMNFLRCKENLWDLAYKNVGLYEQLTGGI